MTSSQAWEVGSFVPSGSPAVGNGVQVAAVGPPFTTQWAPAGSGGGGIADAPNDATLYGRRSGAWAHLGHADIADWATAPIVYGQLPVEVQQIPIAFPFAGKPPAGGLVNVPMAFAVTFSAGLAGAVIYAGAVSTLGAVFTVNRISGGVTTALGTVTLAGSSHSSAALAGAGGGLAVGDVLQLVAPATQDATLADVGVTLLAMRV